MDIDMKNSSGMMNGMPPSSKSDRKVGPIVGALIIILILIIAALYFLGKRLNTQPIETPVTTPPIVQETPIDGNMNQASLSASTEVQDLQADLDKQMQDVDYSF